MHQLVPKWNWTIWDMEKVNQEVPKKYWPNLDVVETYHLVAKYDWPIWDIERTYQHT